uniref:Chitin-binding type-2 domain-containing protein n=1 Tax=Phragmatopoma lapidosa TaxID=341668 RepID=A0A0A0R225_9ANNE|nr:hypothetical protein [Phragmatopoma lapidosa]
MILLYVLSVVCVAYGQDNPCVVDGENVEDGHYLITCKSYVWCIQGTPAVVECPIGEVYNADKDPPGCDDKGNVGAPCGTERDCAGRSDGWYPVCEAEAGWDECELFYSCVGETDMGTEQCPDGLVFDPKEEVCNWPASTCVPCGTSVDEEICADVPDVC